MTPPAATSPAIEAAAALLLGAGEAQARAAAEALREQGLLAHGMVFTAVLAAARWGVEPADAIVRFAHGDQAPDVWSAYEQRSAAAEAGEEAHAAIAGLLRRRAAAAAEQPGAAEHAPAVQVADLLEAVSALGSGAGELTLDQPLSTVELRWLTGLAARCQALVSAPRRSDEPDHEAVSDVYIPLLDP